MTPEIMNALPFILIALAVAAIAIWALLRANRKAKVIAQPGDSLKRDVLDEGAARAARNQALIDAAPAASADAPPAVSAAANTQAVAAAPLGTDAEAGPQIVPTTAAPPQAAQPSPAADPAPAPAPAAAAAAAERAGSDDLTRIKGLGPKLASTLGALGVTSFAEIAAWNDADIARIDAQLGRFAGRITRDQWVAQAQLLAAGDEAGFAAKFGKNG